MTVLIIGGGLSGLALADALEMRGEDYSLLEARTRLGGRIKTEHHETGYFDMGPAWFWPGQPRIAALIERLNLEKFDQFSTGDLAYEDGQGRVQYGRGIASMEGSWRLKGGLGAMIQALANRVPEGRKRLDTKVTHLTRTQTGITAHLSTGDNIKAQRVVISMPPRIAANITYTPSLPHSALTSMKNIPTWMAGQSKAIAVYDTPFWRENGLSGDAHSQRGPMVEIHDASPAQGGPYAVFGFIGIPPENRTNTEAMRRGVTEQLVRLFGPQAATPKQVYVKDWAYDLNTAAKADRAPLYTHPHYGMPSSLTNLWDNNLLFSGTEVATQFGGYLEGALEAAENTLKSLEI